MKTAAFVLVLAFGGLQTVRYTNCGCPDICARQGMPSGSGCGTCEKPEKRGDCCDQKEDPASAGCVHLEPSADVVATMPTIDIVPPVEIHHVVVASDVFAPPEEPSADDRFTPVRPARGRPLFLLLSSLLI